MTNRWALLLVGITGLQVQTGSGLRTESFERDPVWDGHNNRSASTAARTVNQDFGYSVTSHTGNTPGEIGGLITPAWEPAYYAKKLPTRTFSDHLTAAGTINCTGRKFHTLLGFFNANSLGAWRTPNTISLRLIGRGDCFYAYVEYCTSKFRAGGDSPQGFVDKDPVTGQPVMRRFPLNTPLHWTIDYDPQGNSGQGALTVTLGGQTAICHLGVGHKADGAIFNRFGLLTVMKSVDDAGEVWVGDLEIEGAREDFSRNPGWEGFNNRRTYSTRRVRPAFDFGYSPTRFAGGKSAGEIGGVVFRGDGRFANKVGYYGDRLENLDLTKPLSAAGRISLQRAASDSTTLLGFFHSKESIAVSESQKSGWPKPFLGLAVEGPSPDGFFVYPVYRVMEDRQSKGRGTIPPVIYPNGKSHLWTLNYTPGDPGSLMVSLNGNKVEIPIPSADQRGNTRFDRFGIITTTIDGNGQLIYFDDLIYTFSQRPATHGKTVSCCTPFTRSYCLADSNGRCVRDTAASIRPRKSGCARFGRDLNSG